MIFAHQMLVLLMVTLVMVDCKPQRGTETMTRRDTVVNGPTGQRRETDVVFEKRGPFGETVKTRETTQVKGNNVPNGVNGNYVPVLSNVPNGNYGPGLSNGPNGNYGPYLNNGPNGNYGPGLSNGPNGNYGPGLSNGPNGNYGPYLNNGPNSDYGPNPNYGK